MESVLLDPHAVGRHACWWSTVESKKLTLVIVQEERMPALSRHPYQASLIEDVAESEAQVMLTLAEEGLETLLNHRPSSQNETLNLTLKQEQLKDSGLCQIQDYLETQ